MSGVGPFEIGTVARLNWEVQSNGVPIDVADARVERVILPDGTDMANFPRPMYKAKTGLYILETTFEIFGNYTAIFQAKYGNETIESIAEFVVTRAWGFPQIRQASNT